MNSEWKKEGRKGTLKEGRIEGRKKTEREKEKPKGRRRK